MILKQLQKEVESSLRTSSIKFPKLESQIFLTHVLKLQLHEYYMHEEDEVTPEGYKQIYKMVRCRKEKMPVAYILGTKEFFGRIFYVNEHTLIPRPETEELVEFILKENTQVNAVLDLGCGSGCIGITLGQEMHIKKLFFSDMSKKALDVSKKNIELHPLPPSSKFLLINSDLFKSNMLQENTFDLIVSNPPYILPDEMSSLMSDVHNYEPILALQVPDVNFSNRLLKDSWLHLAPAGKFYLENNPSCIDSLADAMYEIGFKNIAIKKDLSGKNRFLYGEKN